MSTVIATKEQERKALEKIKEIVESLGEDSYVGTALKDCFEIAEENIEYDFADSLQDRLQLSKSISDDLLQKSKALASENEALKNKIVRLEEELEKEQEWQEYESNDNVKQADYEKLADSAGTRRLDDDEAKEIINEWFGFDKDRIKILRSVSTYQKDRHNRVRRTEETLDRTPLYQATDWNYIRFVCCGMHYELNDGNLQFYSY